MANNHVRPGQAVPWRNDTGAAVRSGQLVSFGGGVAAKVLHDIPDGGWGEVTLSQVHRVPLPAGLAFSPGDLVHVQDGQISDSGDLLGRFIRLDEGGWAEILILPLTEGGGGGGTSDIAWKPNVSPEGLITWTRTSSTTAPAARNIMGPAGPAGADGAPGAQGEPGEKGEQGDPGVGARAVNLAESELGLNIEAQGTITRAYTPELLTGERIVGVASFSTADASGAPLPLALIGSAVSANGRTLTLTLLNPLLYNMTVGSIQVGLLASTATGPSPVVTVDDHMDAESLNPVQNRVLLGVFESQRQVMEYMQGRITANETAIGDLSDLTTTAKTDLVAAANEIRATAAQADQALGQEITALQNAGYQTAAQVDGKIAAALETFDKLDYKVADSPPTPTTVVIKGQTEQTQPGVRYMVKHSTDDRYEEYILVDGAIYDIGSTGDIDLSAYATTAAMDTALAAKQDTLVSGTNLKTLNGESLLGGGNQVMAQLRNVAYEGVIRETNINDAAGRLDLDYTPTDGTVGLKATRDSVVRNLSLATADYVNGKAQFTTAGDWRYRIYPDNTFEAYYSKVGVEFEINNSSGAFYRSALATLNLPSAIANSTVLHASIGTSHNNYPAFGVLASLATGRINYYALSGGSRGKNSNYTVSAHVFGVLTA